MQSGDNQWDSPASSEFVVPVTEVSYMPDNTWSDDAESDTRTPALKRAIAEAGDEMSATIGLPDEIKPGEFTFTFMHDVGGRRPVANEITFNWDGGWTTTWMQDISPYEDISPGSSAPAHGWASWRNGSDLLLAYTWSDLETDGWAHIPGGAPGSGLPAEEAEDSLDEPHTWVELGQLIAGTLFGKQLPGQTGQTFQ